MNAPVLLMQNFDITKGDRRGEHFGVYTEFLTLIIKMWFCVI